MRLCDFKDLYQGQMIVVLGGGPSLVSDVVFLRSSYGSLQEHQTKIFLGTNHHALTVGIQPDYLVCFDDLRMRPEVWRWIDNSNVPTISMNGPSDVEVDIPQEEMWFGSGSGGWAAWIGVYQHSCVGIGDGRSG